MKFVVSLTTLLFIFQLSSFGTSDTHPERFYYWRDYAGTIPQDAVLGGRNEHGDKIYIGQAYVPNVGLIVSEIYKGLDEVEIPYHGIETIDSNIKILCANYKDLYWARMNSTNLYDRLLQKDPVIGGYEPNGRLYIGRIKENGVSKIGKITTKDIDHAVFYYNDNGIESSKTTFEMLAVKNTYVV